MPSLRAVRRSVPFDAGFAARHPLFWPLERAARAFAASPTWPPVASWNALFAGVAPVEFVAAAPRPRRARRASVDPSALYDASITGRGVVPSRERHWHDFMNALVWTTFPRAKAALHRRQGALVAARIDPRAPRLPAHRTRAQDGLAMIDEGGVVALVAPARELHLVFGHAVYEGFVLGVRAMTARMVRLAVPVVDDDPLAQADAALAAALAADDFSTLPEALPRVFVPDEPTAAWLR